MDLKKLKRAAGVTDEKVGAVIGDLLLAGRAMAWLERARMAVQAGAADYERGYGNILALVQATEDARAAYDNSVQAGANLFDPPIPLDAYSREEAARLVPDALNALLTPMPHAQVTRAPATASAPESPIEGM